MEEPLGLAVGNTIEIIESINALKGNMQQDVKEVVLELGSYMIKLAQKGDNIEENKETILNCINSNKAYEKFLELVEKQGGDITYCEDISKFRKAKYEENIISTRNGYIKQIKAEKVGKCACYLGAGRVKKEDEIDKEAGILLNKKVGDYVGKGELIATLYTNDISKVDEAKRMFNEAIEIQNEKTEKEKMILDII